MSDDNLLCAVCDREATHDCGTCGRPLCDSKWCQPEHDANNHDVEQMTPYERQAAIGDAIRDARKDGNEP